MKYILKLYEESSDQKINFKKSDLYFSSNTRSKEKEVVKNVLGIRSITNPEKYLGLPKNLCDEINGIIRNYWWRLKVDKKAFTGSVGTYVALQNSKGEWASEIWENSTKLCSVNKVGGSYIMTKPLHTKS